MSKRLVFGTLLGAIMLGGLLGGGISWAITLGTCAVIAGKEYIHIVKAKSIRPSERIIVNMIIAFFVLAAAPSIPGVHISQDFPIDHYPLLFTTGVFVSFFRLLFRTENPPATIADVSSTILGFIYLGWMPSHLVLLRNVIPAGSVEQTNPLLQPGLAFVWASLFMIWATDIVAYYAGKTMGKNLLYPQVSPKKTVEGAIAGLLGAIIFGLAVVYASDNYLFPNHPFQGKLWQCAIMAVLVSIGSQLGDLCESMLKRDAGLKDSGNLIPGHGGMLDRGDGLLFAAPISYYFICLVVLNIL